MVPKRPIRCLSISSNIADYAPAYDSLINACSSLPSNENSNIRRIREHNANVQRVFSLDNIRRFLRYNTQNPNLSAADKEKQKKVINDAINNYKTTSTKFLTEINSLVAALDPTTVSQECQQTIQTASIAQITEANALVLYPKEMCDAFNSALATFQNAIDSAYTKIGKTP